MGVRISLFAPELCNTSGLDEYADGCRIQKEQVGTLFVWVRALEGGFGGVDRPRGPPQKVDVPYEKTKAPSCCKHTSSCLLMSAHIDLCCCAEEASSPPAPHYR